MVYERAYERAHERVHEPAYERFFERAEVSPGVRLYERRQSLGVPDLEPELLEPTSLSEPALVEHLSQNSSSGSRVLRGRLWRRFCERRAAPSLATRCPLERALTRGSVAHERRTSGHASEGFVTRAAALSVPRTQVPRGLVGSTGAGVRLRQPGTNRRANRFEPAYEPVYEPTRTGLRTGLRTFTNRLTRNYEPAYEESRFLSFFGPDPMQKNWFFMD